MRWQKPIYFKGEQVDVVVDSAEGLSERQLNRFLRLTDRFVSILNSANFKVNLCSLSANELTETNGKTSCEVYEHIMTGKDAYDKAPDGLVEIRVVAYMRRWSRTVGYTYPNTRKFWTNLKFWAYSDAYLIGNIAHECLGHNLGYNHYIRGGHATSVPYVVGNIFKRLATMPVLTPLSESSLEKLTPPKDRS